MARAGDWAIYRLRTDGGHGEVHVRIRADATVADLSVALGRPTDAAVLIDGRPCRPGDGLDEIGLCQGSIVDVDPPCVGTARPAARSGTSLVVRHGLSAGARLELGAGRYLIGRSPACDLVLDDASVELLHVSARAGDPTAATAATVGLEWLAVLDGAPPPVEASAATPVRVGQVELQVEHDPPHDPDPSRRRAAVDTARDRSGRGTVLFNRPPRVRPGPPGPLPVRPTRPATPGVAPLALASIVAPVLLSAVLVVVTRSWLFALLTALSPVMALANWISGRRRARRQGRRHRREFSRRLRGFEQDLCAARDQQDALARARAVDLGEVARRITLPAPSLWERRLGDDDALHITVGRAALRWRPSWPAATMHPATGGDGQDGDDAVAEVIDRAGVAAVRPVELALGDHGVVGVVGDRRAARRLIAGAVVQLAAHHGPADLAVLAVVDAASRAQWDWVRWLPHRVGDGCDDAGDVRRDPTGRPTGGLHALIRDGHGATPPEAASRGGRRLVLVVDADDAITSRASPVRAALRGDAGPVVGLVLADRADRLPASCRVIVELTADGTARLSDLTTGSVVEDIEAMGTSVRTARRLAAALARFEDPELDLPSGGLPDVIGVLDLLGVDPTGPDSTRPNSTAPDPVAAALADRAPDVDADEAALAAALRLRWAATPPGRPSLRCPLGVGADGPVEVDLVADGPHALVAGTTGAGKSELLRSWIVGLAAVASPAAVNFVLIDFKGGSAFDACAQLPHTVSVITDLDGQLAERVLRCLLAELGHREHVLRRAGVADIAELTGPADPQLARLVVVIDEFAALAADVPGFGDTLVGIAQRGRSLGVHLILATQRPSGVVNDQIRANTNIRVALRVQDRADSTDVIDRPDAAELDRRTPGRALLRLGRNEVRLIQTALSSVRGRDHGHRRVQLLTVDQRPMGDAVAGTASGRSDLERLVGAAVRSARALALPAARVPWPEPLPATVGLSVLGRQAGADGAGGGGTDAAALVGFLLVDDPDRQRRELGGWRPELGNLIVYGTTGSGATTALASLVCALAERDGPERTHVHLIGDDPALRPLAALPHVGSFVSRSDRERLVRLLAHLESELTARRAGAGDPHGGVRGRPMTVLVVDGFGSLVAELTSSAADVELADRLCRLVIDGASAGIHVVLSAEHASAVRHGVAASVSQKLVLRLAEPLEARQLGVAPVAGPPGRGRLTGCGRLVHVAEPGPLADRVRGLAERWPTGAQARRPWRARRLPDRCPLADLPPAAALAGPDAPQNRSVLEGPHPASRTTAWWLPLGVGGTELDVLGWTLASGDGALIAGPPRSGRSNALLAIAAGLHRAQPAVAVLATAARRSPLRASPILRFVPPADLPAALTGTGTGSDLGTDADAPGVLLVDDAEQFDDPDGIIAAALARGWTVVAAGRTDALRTAYGHWTRGLRAGRTGLLLQADLTLDGDLFGVRLPRRPEAPLDVVGRGLLVQEGRVQLVQVAAAGGPTGGSSW